MGVGQGKHLVACQAHPVLCLLSTPSDCTLLCMQAWRGNVHAIRHLTNMRALQVGAIGNRSHARHGGRASGGVIVSDCWKVFQDRSSKLFKLIKLDRVDSHGDDAASVRAALLLCLFMPKVLASHLQQHL